MIAYFCLPLTHDKKDFFFGQNDENVYDWLWIVLYWWEPLVPMPIMRELTLETVVWSAAPDQQHQHLLTLFRHAGSSALPRLAWIKLWVEGDPQVIRMPIKVWKAQFCTTTSVPPCAHTETMWKAIETMPTTCPLSRDSDFTCLEWVPDSLGDSTEKPNTFFM